MAGLRAEARLLPSPRILAPSGTISETGVRIRQVKLAGESGGEEVEDARGYAGFVLTLLLGLGLVLGLLWLGLKKMGFR